jgi:glycosyltransferase involved in cell wall biosynthesis
VSIVIPMLDAGARVRQLHERLSHVVGISVPHCELILVDDASTDDTWKAISGLALDDPRVVGVRLGRNVGQTGALCAGFAVASGPVVVMMDDDLETEPAELLRFVAAVRDGAEFASGWRKGPRPLSRAVGSSLYNARLRSWGLPFHDAGCGFNAMTLDLALALSAEGWGVRQHRFKPTVARLTDNIVEVSVPVQLTDESHHTLESLATSWLDVELRFGGLTARRYVAAAVVGPAVGATAATSAVARRSAPVGIRLLAGFAAIGGFATSFVAWRVLRRREEDERRSRELPAFEIAETTERR